MAQLSRKDEARKWRDDELARTDIAATVSDFPNAAEIMAYRQALRDWPQTPQFPKGRPTVEPIVEAPAEEDPDT